MTAIQTDWKTELKTLRDAWFKAKYQAANEFGTPFPKPYRDNTSNDLTRCVCDYLKFAGHYANRINVAGRVRIEKIQFAGGGERQNVHWQKGHTNPGTGDIDAIIAGRPVKVEIKCKSTNDRISNDQLKEKARIEAAGGFYWIVTDMPNFLEQYKAFINEQRQ